MNDPAPLAAPPAAAWRTLVLLGLALGLVTLLTYSNSFEAGLTLDNTVVITQDPRIREWNGQNLRLIFQENYWWPYAASDLYRPLTTLSYLGNYAVLGNGPRVAGYHWVNFLLHWANAWLVLVILRRLTARPGVALLAAALFAVHPVNVESVTNIIGRADLLAAFSILAGGWCYLRAAGVSGLRKLPWLGGVALLACAGVLMKESAVMIGAMRSGLAILEVGGFPVQEVERLIEYLREGRLTLCRQASEERVEGALRTGQQEDRMDRGV